MFTVDTCCTLAPYYEVQDGQLDAFKALALKLVAKTRTEPGCMHYAFSSAATCHPRKLRSSEVPMQLQLECEREDDGRWLAEISAIPGVLAYGASADEAMAKAEVLAGC